MSTIQPAGGEFIDDIKQLVPNLKTTDDQLLRLINKVYSKEGSSQDQNVLNHYLKIRMEKASSISSLLKFMGDISRAIIQNLRA